MKNYTLKIVDDIKRNQYKGQKNTTARWGRTHSEGRGRRNTSSRPAWSIQQDPVLKKTKQNKTSRKGLENQHTID
jgi:hypothetical protein